MSRTTKKQSSAASNGCRNHGSCKVCRGNRIGPRVVREFAKFRDGLRESAEIRTALKPGIPRDVLMVAAHQIGTDHQILREVRREILQGCGPTATAFFDRMTQRIAYDAAR